MSQFHSVDLARIYSISAQLLVLEEYVLPTKTTYSVTDLESVSKYRWKLSVGNSIVIKDS